VAWIAHRPNFKVFSMTHLSGPGVSKRQPGPRTLPGIGP
jgi:hypothetical protein